MRILRTTATFYPHVTGPSYQAYRISEGLEDRGHTSPIFTSDYKPDSQLAGYPPSIESISDFGFEVKRFPSVFSFHQYRVPPTALIEYLKDDFDLVHCHGYHSAIKDVLFFGLLIKDKPFVLHAHGSFGKHKDPTIEEDIHLRLYDLFGERTLRRADAVIVSSSQERKEAIQFGVDPDKIHIVPVGKDLETYTSVERHIPSDELRILFVGRLAPRRNLELVLKGIKQFQDTHPNRNLEFRIVGGEDSLSEASGGGYKRELERLAKRLGISDEVKFVGPKYGDELIQEFRTASLFVNPSHYENFGQATLEAAFAGLPIISTLTGVASDLLEEGKTGYPIQDAETLSNALSQFAKDSDLIEEMGNAAQQKAVDNYTWPQIIDSYIEIYESLI